MKVTVYSKCKSCYQKQTAMLTIFSVLLHFNHKLVYIMTTYFTHKILTNCARNKQLQLVHPGDLQHIVQALNVDLHSQRDISLANSTQQSTEMDQPINLMVDANLLQGSHVQHIGKEKWSWKVKRKIKESDDCMRNKNSKQAHPPTYTYTQSESLRATLFLLFPYCL